MERIKLITGNQTQAELAALLGVTRESVSDAEKRGKIPSSWLVILMWHKHANPEWILTGSGPVFAFSPPHEARYETGAEAAEHWETEAALRRLPARMLADELVRRIAVAENRAFCSKLDE